MIPMTTDEERRITRLLRDLSAAMSSVEKHQIIYDFMQASIPKPPAPPSTPEMEELLDMLKRAEWACWAEHAECPSCGAEPDVSYHKYGIENGGHYPGCRLAKALGAKASPTRPGT